MKKRVLLAGEPMGLLMADTPGGLAQTDRFTLDICGAELNVAIGLRRLGHDVTYVTRLGNDFLGERILEGMERDGISTKAVLRSNDHATGFMFKGKAQEGDPEICYFRKGSAASTLCPEDVEKIDFTNYDLLHLTGITPALAPCTRMTAEALFRKAKDAGCIISFDPNLRLQLWPDREEMTQCINKLAAGADLFLPGVQEAETLMGSRDLAEIADYYLSLGTGTVIVKTGSDGAFYASKTGARGAVPGFPIRKVVDTVGAGDGFAAGVLSAILEEFDLEDAVRRGCAIGAIQVMSRGDNDGLPTRKELEDFINGEPDWRCQDV